MDQRDLRGADTDRLIETIVGLTKATDPRVSPDGRWVAYANAPYFREGEHPRATIWLAPADASLSARPFTSGAGCDDTPRWSPDGRALAFLSDRLTPGVKSLYRIAVDGGEGQLLVERTRRGIDRVAWSPDGGRIAFTAIPEPDTPEDARDDAAQVYGRDRQCARLCVLDLASGAVSMLPTGDVHVRQVAWSPDGSRLAYLAWPTPEEEAALQATIEVILADGGAPRRLCALPSAQSAWFAWPIAQRILCVAPRMGRPQSSFAVFAVEASGDAATVLAPAAGDPCCAAGCQGVEGDSRVAVAVAQETSTRLEWLHPLTGARAALHAFPEGDVHEFSAAVGPEGPVLAVTQSTGHAPPELYVGRPGRLARVTSHHAALVDVGFGHQEPFRYTATDGLALDGVFIRPAGTYAAPWPTLVLPHGGPYGRSANGFHMLWGQLLAARGYAVLLPNYRGGSGRGEAFASMVRGDVGGAEFRDVIAAADAAVSRGLADERRLGIGGWSQGGFLAAWAVTQTTRFRAAVMGAGVSHWGMEVMTSDMPTFEGVLAGGRPWDGPGSAFGELRSPVSFARNVTTPVLILHGQDDRRVPVSQGIAFERALRAHGAPVQLVTYPNAPHQIQGRDHQRDILRRVVGWFDRWLLGTSPETADIPVGSEPSSGPAPYTEQSPSGRD